MIPKLGWAHELFPYFLITAILVIASIGAVVDIKSSRPCAPSCCCKPAK